MFDERKDFYTEKASQLLETYKKNWEFAKARFVKNLIEYQNAFGTESILDRELLLYGCYTLETVTSVLDDLNYDLVSFRTEPMFFNQTFAMVPFLVIKFKPKSSDNS